MSDPDQTSKKDGQRLALVIAVVGVLWVLANVLGSELGLSNRVRALLDLFVLAAFGWAIWRGIALWRSRN